jgi:hypothetical protein
MKNLFLTKFRFSTLFFSVISLVLATCALGASAFSSTCSKRFFLRYYTENERCGIRIAAVSRNAKADPSAASSSASTSTTSSSIHPLFLYKDTSRQTNGLPSCYSSVTDNSWTSTPLNIHIAEKYMSRNKKKELAPMRKILRGVSNAFSLVADVVTETVAKAPLKIRKVIADSRAEEQKQVVTLVDINWLKAHEDVVSEERVKKLYEATIGWNAYRLPLLVDSRSGAILDGHHRYAVGRVLGLSRLPAILVDYLNDDSISVDVWPECGVQCLTKQDVIEMSLSDEVFPPKTSKHDFVSSFSPINIPLSKLL